MIKTRDSLNEKVKEYLEMRGDNMSLYALQRIKELETEVRDLKSELSELQEFL